MKFCVWVEFTFNMCVFTILFSTTVQIRILQYFGHVSIQNSDSIERLVLKEKGQIPWQGTYVLDRPGEIGNWKPRV